MAGIINDGHSTRISFADFPVVEFCEKEVTPPGVEGGGANDTTTMKNTAWRTMQPKKLRTAAEASATVAYETVVYDTIIAMVNVNQLITVTFRALRRVWKMWERQSILYCLLPMRL